MVTISWTRPNIFSTSAFVLPFANSVSSDADALEMQQPEPTKLMSLMVSPSSARKSFNWSPQGGLKALRGAGGRGQFVEIPRLLAVVKDDLLIKIV